MIQPGDKLDTSVTFHALLGGEKTAVTLGELLKRRTIISVYMKNNTSACDLQTADLAATTAEFDALGWDIIAVSKDTCNSHKKYAEKQSITYTLVSDPDYNLSRAADILVEKSMYGKKYLGPLRCAILIEADGTVLGAIEKINPKAHADELKALITEIG
ncbi:MAG: redoxin domain-containing protein [Verrucomicrobiota bacterium]